MGATRVNFFYDQLLVKEPGTREGTPWHQDQPYWALSGLQVCSLWLPLDPVSEEVGVEYVCGSHRWPEFSPYHPTARSMKERDFRLFPTLTPRRTGTAFLDSRWSPEPCWYSRR